MTDHFQFLARQAGLPPIRPHDLRHGAATLRLGGGGKDEGRAGRAAAHLVVGTINGLERFANAN